MEEMPLKRRMNLSEITTRKVNGTHKLANPHSTSVASIGRNLPKIMTVQPKPRPPVPSSSGSSNGRQQYVAKNLWMKNKSCQKRINVCAYNIRSLVGEDRLTELENELKYIKWDIVGLSEVKRSGEELIELRNGSMFYYKGRDSDSNSGVGFIVNRSIKDKVISYRNSGDRIAQIMIQISERYKLQIIQTYAPTSTHEEEEVVEL